MSILWMLCALCGSHIRGFWWPRYAQIVAFYGSNCTIRKAAIHCQSGWFDRCIICPAGRWIWLGMELKGRQGILCSQMDASWIILNHDAVLLYCHVQVNSSLANTDCMGHVGWGHGHDALSAIAPWHMAYVWHIWGWKGLLKVVPSFEMNIDEQWWTTVNTPTYSQQFCVMNELVFLYLLVWFCLSGWV
jgi:hypothetical protein